MINKLLLSITAGALLLAGCGGTGDAPDVRGIALPDAKVILKNAGYSASVTSDAMFGVIIEQNFTVCDENAPKGSLVALKVSKAC